MNTIKKTLPAVLAAIMIAAAMLPAPVKAYADVMPDPVDDQFYEEHRSECAEYGNKWGCSFYTYGPDETVELYRSPESLRTVMEYKNGEMITIEVIYTAPDGTKWGAMRYLDESSEGIVRIYHYAWVPMAYLCSDYSSALRLPKPDVIPAIKTHRLTVIITCVAVAVVAVIAVVLIMVVLKKKKKSEKCSAEF